MKQRVSSDHLPPTTAAKTTSLARLSVPESSGHVLSLRRRAGGTLASALRRPRLDTGDLGSAQVKRYHAEVGSNRLPGIVA